MNPKGYRITGTTTSNIIKVEPNVTTDITLDNVSVTSSGTKNCMDVSHANVTITLVGNNLLPAERQLMALWSRTEWTIPD